MRSVLCCLAVLALLASPLAAANGPAPQVSARPEPPIPLPAPTTEEVCVLKTNMGTMVFRFFEEDAPLTSAHFKKLVREGFYDGKPFYRVVKGHVIQGGDGEGNVGPKVQGELKSSVKHPHVKGAVGLARDKDPDTGSTEFYICLEPRTHLDGKYAIFGELIEGMDVLEKIGNVEVNPLYVKKVAFHEPKQPVIIEKATIEMRDPSLPLK